jgi:hypothetical protein
MINGMPNAQPRPYFGPFLGTATSDVVSNVYHQLVNAPSNEAPSLVYVKPGSLSQSFLWHKLDNDLQSIQSACTSGMTPPCGLVMPNDGMPLSATAMDDISGWIQAGAPLN